MLQYSLAVVEGSSSKLTSPEVLLLSVSCFFCLLAKYLSRFLFRKDESACCPSLNCLVGGEFSNAFPTIMGQKAAWPLPPAAVGARTKDIDIAS